MPGPKCVVEFCNNNGYKSKSQGKTIGFHRFPRDPGLRQEWILKCGRDEDFKADYAFVCSEHFKKEDYKRDMQAELLGYVGRKKLKPQAVPSLNLPFEEEEYLSPIEREKAEKEKHEKIIQDCLNGTNEYKGILSFEMFKKMRYKNSRIKRSRKTVSETEGSREVILLTMSPDDLTQNFDINSALNGHDIITISNSEDDITNFSENSKLFLNGDYPVDIEGASYSAEDSGMLEREGGKFSSEDPVYLKERIQKLEEKVRFQERVICKLKRGILREKKMMEKVVLATNSGCTSQPQKKKKVQFDEKARNALLEIYSLDPDSYSRFSRALDLPSKLILSSWNPQVCPPPQAPAYREFLDESEFRQHFKEEYIIETRKY